MEHDIAEILLKMTINNNKSIFKIENHKLIIEYLKNSHKNK